jgi:hypothetical protein
MITYFLSLFTPERDLSHLFYNYWLIYGGIGLIAGYLGLAACLNKTVVTISPEKIETTTNPLPGFIWRTRQLKVETLDQVEAVRTLLTHELQAVCEKKRVVLLGSLPETAAFYLEEAINDYLGLPLPVEPRPYNKQEWAELYKFAEEHQLGFRISKASAAPVLTGLYKGCQLKIRLFQVAWRSLYLTSLTLSGVQREVLPLPTLAQDQSTAQVAQLLETLLLRASNLSLSGTVALSPDGQHLLYEEDRLRRDPAVLQEMSDIMVEFLKLYPRLANLGTFALPFLQPLAVKEHPFQPVLKQLLHHIAKESQNRLGERSRPSLCPTCFRRCISQELKLSLTDRLSYYGCRACGQNLEFLEVEKRVVALLDTQMSQNYLLREGVLFVNWLLHRQSFDFDEVYIRRATDEDVERFASQAGNDTDPLQQPRYSPMRCLIWPEAELSENSLKILQHTFGRVERVRQEKLERLEAPKSASSQISRLSPEAAEEGVEDAEER